MEPTITATPEDVNKQIHDLRDLLQKQKIENDELKKREASLTVALEERDKKIVNEPPAPKAIRQGFFSEGDVENGKPGFVSDKAVGYQNVVKQKAVTDRDKEIHRVNDEIYTVSQLTGKHPTHLASYKQFQMNSAVSDLRKALNTSDANAGNEWVPVGYSATMFEQIVRECYLSTLFEHIAMPTDVYKPPTLAFTMVAYYTPESKVDEAVKPPTSALTTDDFTLTAKKMTTSGVWSGELVESAIVPLVPNIMKAASRAFAEMRDNVILNGDTAATLDSDIISALDQRRAWSGIRKLCQTGTMKADCSTFTTAAILGILGGMGDYSDVSRNIIIVPNKVQTKMIGLAEVITVDKYGPDATILKGEIGKFLGRPIIISPKYRTDLNTAGAYDGSTMTKTGFAIVHTSAFVFGDRANITMETNRLSRTDQWELIGRERVAFASPYVLSTVPMIGLGYNVA